MGQPHSAVLAQAIGLTSPTSGSTISGIVLVEGTATDANFLRYELAFLQDANPGAGWIVFADGDQPVFAGTLWVWDTTVGQNANAPVFPDGSYQLRLRIVKADFNYDEYFVQSININNGNSAPPPSVTPVPLLPTDTPVPAPPPPPTDAPPPPPTLAAPLPLPGESTAVPVPSEATPVPLPPTTVPTETPIPTPVPTATPLPERVEPTIVPTIAITPIATQLDVLPSLTPFPTPTAQATAERSGGFGAVFSDDEAASDASADSIIEQVLESDYSVLGQSFRNGMRYTLVLFLMIGLYLLLRGFIRWIWRTISSNW